MITLNIYVQLGDSPDYCFLFLMPVHPDASSGHFPEHMIVSGDYVHNGGNTRLQG